tara:strand:+ start:345 stop:590 length:246 start_codon:yes stop_codon:yes gene_type:complete
MRLKGRKYDYAELTRKELEELTNELRAERNSLVVKLDRLDEKICESLSYKTTKQCVVPGTKIPYVNWIQAWLVSLRAKRKK